MAGDEDIPERLERIEVELESIKQYYEESVSFSRENKHDAALWKARKAAEAICYELYLRTMGKAPKTSSLGHLIDELDLKHRVIPKKIAAPLRTIQEYGNYGTHHQQEEKAGSITAEYAKPSLDALATVVEWYFSEYGESDGSDDQPAQPPAACSPLGPPRPDLSRRMISWMLGGLLLAATGAASALYYSQRWAPQTGDSIVVGPTLPTPSVEPPRPTVAVLPFECLSADDPESLALQGRVSSLVRSRLEDAGRFEMVERSRLERVLAELELSKSKKFDQSQVARIGKLLGARRLVLGDYFHLGDSLRVNVRFVDTETGRILWSAGHDGSASDVAQTAAAAAAAVLERIPEDS